MRYTSALAFSVIHEKLIERKEYIAMTPPAGASVGWRLFFSSIDGNRPDFARERPNAADG
jgi:hypothetical protein